VSLSVSAEAEEAACALFETQLGVTPSVLTDLRRKTTRVVAYLPKPVAAGDRRLAMIRSALRRLSAEGMDIGPNRLTLSAVPREDWAESWKRHFKPLKIGGRLLLRASWHEASRDPAVTEVVLDPGLSFGTGHHATTAYCLREVVRAGGDGLNHTMLDVGCGSGVLAIAAAKLGFRRVEGFDNDREAVRVARANAESNGVLVPFVARDIARLPVVGGRVYDLVCANLIAPLLIEHAPRLCARMHPRSRLVLAGILTEQFSEVQRGFERHRLKLVRSRIEREWRSGTFERG